MKTVRRSSDSLGARKLHGIDGSGKHDFEQLLLVRGELAEDMADHFAGLAAADAELEAGKCVGAEVLEDGFDAVVAAGGAFFPEPQAAEWQRDIVVDDEHVGGGPFVEREDLLDGAAAEVHKRLRLEQDGAGARQLGEVTLPFRDGLERDAFCGGKAVEQHETDVVTGVFILPARVAKADDEGKGHAGRDRRREDRRHKKRTERE